MTDETLNVNFATIDEHLAQWRQGDCVLGEHWFVYRIHPTAFVTQEAKAVAEEGLDLVETPVLGFTIVTQTCDIVRSCKERPYLELCPLVKVDEGRLHEIERGRRPAYAYLPLLAHHQLVADLDRVMTVEKSVVVSWIRTPGWTHDIEIRHFALALSRKRIRFAFPDDFTDFVHKLQNRLTDKHEKNSEEGRGLRALSEIRIYAAPSWDAEQVELMFWFIRKENDSTFEGKSWYTLLDVWLKLLPQNGRFIKIQGQVVALEDLTAVDYVNSDPLDLDHLSLRS